MREWPPLPSLEPVGDESTLPCQFSGWLWLRVALVRLFERLFERLVALGVPGGIFCKREGWRLSCGTKGSSPGTVSSVKPVRAFGARANAAASGARGRSMLKLFLMKDRVDMAASVEGRTAPFWYCILPEPVESLEPWVGRVGYASASFSSARLTFHVAISSSPMGVRPLLNNLCLRRFRKYHIAITITRAMPTKPSTVVNTMTSFSWPEISRLTIIFRVEVVSKVAN